MPCTHTHTLNVANILFEQLIVVVVIASFFFLLFLLSAVLLVITEWLVVVHFLLFLMLSFLRANTIYMYTYSNAHSTCDEHHYFYLSWGEFFQWQKPSISLLVRVLHEIFSVQSLWAFTYLIIIAKCVRCHCRSSSSSRLITVFTCVMCIQYLM